MVAFPGERPTDFEDGTGWVTVMKLFFLDLVKKRISVRKYLDKVVEREKIEVCLEAARLAPSACNSQPWTFMVVDDPEIKSRLCNRIFSGPYRMNSFAEQAPVLVVVISEKSRFFAALGGLIRNTNFYLLDVGCAVEHFVLQAAELGLGTCWIGWFNEKEAKKVLSIPRNKKIDVVLSLGYPAINDKPRIRKSISEISKFV